MDASWATLAACRPEDPDDLEERRRLLAVFFSPDGDYREAARYCRRCPVRPECAVYAGEVRPSHGWWAGAARDADASGKAVVGCHRCGDHVGASGLRKPGGRWCSLACYRADMAGVPLLHVDGYGNPAPQARPAGVTA